VPLTHQPGGPPAGGQVHGLREAVAAAQRAGKRAVVATPRVLKPGEDGLAAFYLRLAPTRCCCAARGSCTGSRGRAARARAPACRS